MNIDVKAMLDRLIELEDQVKAMERKLAISRRRYQKWTTLDVRLAVKQGKLDQWLYQPGRISARMTKLESAIFDLRLRISQIERWFRLYCQP